MFGLYFVLFLIGCLCMVAGMVNPRIVIKWGTNETKTRGKVFKQYGVISILFLVLASAPKLSPQDKIAMAQQKEFNKTGNVALVKKEEPGNQNIDFTKLIDEDSTEVQKVLGKPNDQYGNYDGLEVYLDPNTNKVISFGIKSTKYQVEGTKIGFKPGEIRAILGPSRDEIKVDYTLTMEYLLKDENIKVTFFYK